MSSPTLSVVIPTYNRLDLLRTCLASLERHRPPADHPRLEVIVVDDASVDGTAAWVTAHAPGVRLVRLERNGGFARAANAGLRAATGQFVQVLNNDAEVAAGWAEAGLAAFDDSRVGSVAPMVLLRRDTGRVDSAGDSYSASGWPAKRGHGEPAGRWAAHPADEVFGPSGSSAIYRAEALERVGMFDEDLGSYYEDVDLAFRLRWAGYTCRFAPSCRILHDISASYDHASRELQRRMSRNLELVFWSNLPARWAALAIPAHAVLIGVQAVLRFRGGRLRPFFAGKLDALRLVGKLRAARADRRKLAARAVSPPRFPLAINPLRALLNHARRPVETSAMDLDPRPAPLIQPGPGA